MPIPSHTLSPYFSQMPVFIKHTSRLQLRPYQVAPIISLQDSIQNQYGDTIIIVFPRQSGKDEFLIQLMAYLLYTHSDFPVSMVAVNPTYKPQTVNALIRFDQVLARNPLTASLWRKKGEFMRLMDQSRISFLSGDSKSNVVGATASLLLIINEAQDISPSFFQHKLHPMVASTRATCLLAGTLWTSHTFLSQEIRHARYLEQQDSRQRVFMVDADHVRQTLPAYGAHVDSVVARWGREHPLVKTQYFNEEIDATTGMFNPARMALIFSQNHRNESSPKFALSRCSSGEEFGGHSTRLNRVGAAEGPGRSFRERPEGVAFLLDLAGQDESVMSDPAARLTNPARDSAALSIAFIDTSTVETLNYPSYTIIHRVEWTGQNHLTIFGQLKTLAENWLPRYIVVDATGVGEGLWALLDKAFPGKVIPVKFTAAIKSDIGYRFLAMINTGRYRVSNSSPKVEEQYLACQSEVLPGPGKTLRWGVPDGTRNAEGALIHDDFVLADALVTQLDDLDWALASPTLFIERETYEKKNTDTDLLNFIDKNF